MPIAFAAGFLLLFAWFKTAQPFDRFFFDASRAQLLTHIAARILLLPYLFCMLFGLGHLLIRALTAKTGALPITPMEEIAIGVLAGSAVLRIAMLALGFANLYYAWPLALAGAAVIAAGSGRLFALLQQIFSSCKEARHTLPKTDFAAGTTLLAAILISVGTVLIQKYIYPFVSGDYLSHYLPYYLEVIERHNLWPNDVWYHFYISKGTGDILYAIMVSDPLAPAAANMVMYIAGVFIGYAFLKRMTQDRLVSLLGTAVMAGAFIYTYEFPTRSVETAQFTSPWATFDREHMLSAVLIFGSVWAGWLLSELPAGARGAWWKLSAVSVVGLVLLRPQMAFLIGGVLGALLLGVLWRRDIPLARAYFGLMTIALASAFTLWGLNILITGLGDGSPFQFFWRFADQEKLSAWVSPFLPLLAILGSSADYGAVSTSQLITPLPTLMAALRLNKILPYFALYGVPFLLACGVAIDILRHKAGAMPRSLGSGLFALGAMLAISLALFFCINQMHSLFRVYAFCVYPVTLLGIAPFALARPELETHRKLRALFACLLALLGVLAVQGEISAVPNTYTRQTLDFFYGEKTVAQAIDEQRQLIRPNICPYVQNGSRLWLFNTWGPVYTAPGCRLQTFYSYSMGPDWAAIVFDTPEAAAEALKKQRIDYFLIDTNGAFFDLLPLSLLFSPKTIGKYFEVVWMEGHSYLLTWPSSHTRPLPARFFSEYRAYLDKSANYHADFRGMHRQLSALYATWKQAPHFPVELDATQPKPRGWQ